MNALLVVGVAVNLILSLVACADRELKHFGFAMMAFTLLSIAGLVAIGTGSKRRGAILVMVGAALSVPLGLIAIMGAMRALDARERGDRPRRGLMS